MNERIERILNACSAARISGYIIDPRIYGVIIDYHKMEWVPTGDKMCPMGAVVFGAHVKYKNQDPVAMLHTLTEALIGAPKGYSEAFVCAIIDRYYKPVGEPVNFEFEEDPVRNMARIDAFAVYAHLEMAGMLQSKLNLSEKVPEIPLTLINNVG